MAKVALRAFQRELLIFIQDYQMLYREAPNSGLLSRVFNCTRANIGYHMTKLVREGYLKNAEGNATGKWRTVQLTDKASKLIGANGDR